MKPELLAPAGDWPSLRAAVGAGADSVYLGIDELNMRAFAQNFTIEGLQEVTNFCHDNHVKVYLTINTIIYDDELSKLQEILIAAKNAEIDAIICWDLAVLKKVVELGMESHLSTQASVANYEALKYYYELGVKRFVLARELDLKQLRSIIQKIKTDKIDAEVEVFAHGAMCISISGRCFLSQFICNKSANRGECLQYCRREYDIINPEDGTEFKLGSGYVMSPKDLCTLPLLDKIMDVGVHAIKIEGRKRPPEYVKIVVQAYRQAIDAYEKGELDKDLKDKLTALVKQVYNRGFSNGFYLGKPLDDWAQAYGSEATKKKLQVGKIINYYPKAKVALVKVEAYPVSKGDEIFIIGNKTGIIQMVLDEIRDEQGNPIKDVTKGQIFTIPVDKQVRENDQVYLYIDIEE